MSDKEQEHTQRARTRKESIQIDKEIQKEAKILKKKQLEEFRMILLGSGDSGISK